MRERHCASADILESLPTMVVGGGDGRGDRGQMLGSS